MARPLSFEIESTSWLRSLRWGAIGVLALVAVAAYFIGAGLPWAMLALTFTLFALWNFLLPQAEERFSLGLNQYLALQVFADILFLSALLWWGGGLLNPLAPALVCEVFLAGLLLGPSLTLMAAAAVSVAVVAVVFAPPLIVRGMPLVVQDSPLWVGRPLGLILLATFTAAFLIAFRRRLQAAEEEQRLKQKMEALSRLVAGLAHELGTPLNSILLLAKESEGESSLGASRRFKSIAQQAKKCGEVVSQLLGYSRSLVRLNTDLSYEPVPLADWILEVYREVRKQEEVSGSKRRKWPDFAVEIVDLPEMVPLPGFILRQVLENLLKNALYALKDEAHPKILVRATQDLVEEELVFEVEDNGPGFTEEGKERAFEAFFSTKTQELSSGMGLYMAYYLVNQVCGRIVIAEHSGRGAILRVSLPRIEELDDQAAA